MAYQLTSTRTHALTHRQLGASNQLTDQIRFQANECEETFSPAEATDSVETPGADPSLLRAETPPETSRWRWVITFIVIALLMIVFSVIVYWGWVQSVWWY